MTENRSISCLTYQCIQERILFEQLLASGAVPSLAIFIDGLNDFFFASGEPYAADLFEQILTTEWLHEHRFQWVHKLPIVQLAARRPEKEPVPRGSPTGLESEYTPDQKEAMAEAVCKRYLNNQQLIAGLAAARGVQVCFVWQPVPTYKYDLQFHPFQEPNLRYHWLAAHGYRHLAALIKTRPPSTNFLWCADMQEQLHEPLYVDAVHYSARMSELLAQEITQMMAERKILR